MTGTEEARYPRVARDRGHYESWYLKAGDPGGGRAVWIRYTVHKRPGAEPEGSVWFTFFDRAAGRPFAVKQTAEPGRLETGSGLIAGIGDLGRFSSRGISGRIAGAGREAAWQLDVSGDGPPLQHLPERLYRTSFPRTKLVSPNPQAVFSGTVEAGGQTVELDLWPGMTGHNWGASHAEKWVWLHGTGFADRGPDTWIDLAFGRVRVGPLTTPWIANGAISLDGVRHRLGGITGSLRSARIEAEAGSCSFRLPGDGMQVAGRITSPAENTVAWVYADPDGPEHHTLNCSVSALQLTVTRSAGEPLTLSTETGGTYEYGSRETGHGIPVEPFPDG